MQFPSYASVVNRVFKEYPMTSTETQKFSIFLQGYKMNIGLKVRRSSQYESGSEKLSYNIERYGWSTGMLKWRSKELKQKLYYLENFFQEEKKDKIDNFLFKDRNVLIEKTYKLTEVPLPLIAFN